MSINSNIFIVAFIFLMNSSYAAENKKIEEVKKAPVTSTKSATPEVKKACIEKKQKDGKMKQVCKDVKVHKKLEGTKVPGQKK